MPEVTRFSAVVLGQDAFSSTTIRVWPESPRYRVRTGDTVAPVVRLSTTGWSWSAREGYGMTRACWLRELVLALGEHIVSH